MAEEIKNENIITEEGYKALEDELVDLKVNQRAYIAQKIKEAREQGDLSENAEYDAAKEEQRHIEGRIEELENLLKELVVVDTKKGANGTVTLGSTVTLLDVEMDEEEKFFIVGSAEADILNNRISNQSPLGSKLMGRRTGTTVQVETPTGAVIEYKILKVEKKRK